MNKKVGVNSKISGRVGWNFVKVGAVAWTAGIALLSLSGCNSEVDGRPSAQSSPSDPTQGIRQTADDGKPLPFHNKYPDRWNSANSGTAYEPCNADDESLIHIGIDPQTIEDAATVNGQTLRGCNWHYSPEESEFLSAYQIVGNSESLNWYKVQNRVGSNWHPDITINGRTVGIASDKSGGCMTYVQSGTAGVVTGSGYGLLPSLPENEICGYAIDLTRATIDKIPK
ncbi:DUF3558 family protein [Gordonia sp. DT218]|uniref:DUF3558 family protein n=1 Tax=Gordonia sp. DT218 TaxID=3416659 RepID=UPI003CF8F63D